MKKIFKPISKLFAFRKVTKFEEGGIDIISTGFISGWVFKRNFNLDQVQFWVNSTLISETRINEFRPDINEKFKIVGNHGFKLEIPRIVLNLGKNINPKVIAVDSINKTKINLNCLFNPNETKYSLVKLITSDFFGLQGYFDGINSKGKLRGWAQSRKINKVDNVWIHSKEYAPIKIDCNKVRPNLKLKNIKDNPSFVVDIKDLPENILGKEIWICFDKRGNFKLPQKEKTIKLPNIYSKNFNEKSQISKKENILKNVGYSNKIVSAPNELKKYWEDLEEYRKYLDKVEYQIDKFLDYKEEKLLKQKKYPSIIRWIKGIS